MYEDPEASGPIAVTMTGAIGSPATATRSGISSGATGTTASTRSALDVRAASANASNAPAGATVSTVDIRNGPPVASLAVKPSSTRRKLCIEEGVDSTIHLTLD